MGWRTVAVIGAGPSGLAASKELLRAGHRVTCFERTDSVGGIFRFREDPRAVSVWPTCRLTSSQLVTSFSDFFPSTDGSLYEHRQLTHAEYVEYLEAYAREMGVAEHVRLNCEARDVSPLPGGRWRVTVRDPRSGATETDEFDGVVICSGLHRVPQIPPLPGLDTFRGRVLHSAHYKGPSSVTGRSALFVGAGESGGDIIGELSRTLERSYLSLRRGTFVLPRLLHGLPNDYTGTRALYSLPEFAVRRTDADARRLARGLERVAYPVTLARRAVDRCQRRARGPSHALSPEVEALIDGLRESAGGNQFETFATKTESFLEAVAEGHCELRPAVREVTPSGVVFADGTGVDVDSIVMCTGFEPPSVPFLGVAVRLDRLFRSCFDPAHGASLAFVGFIRPPLGAIPPMAEMQSRWVAQIFSGARHLPDTATMERHIDATLARRRLYHRHVFERIPQLVDYSTYMDELATEVGCKPRLLDFLTRPRLLYKLYTGAFCGAQYRFRGPHANPQLATRVILRAPSNVRLVSLGDLALAGLARALRLRRLQPRLTLLGERRGSAFDRVA